MERDAQPVVESRLDSLPSLPLLLVRTPRGAGPPRQAPEAERLVLADQALAARVLCVANSPLYGRPGGIVALDLAIRHLGTGVVRRIAAGLASHPSPASAPGLDRPRFVEHFVAAAAASRALARRVGGVPPEEAYAAGLLHSIGQAVFAWGSARKYGEVLRRAAEEGRPLHDLEKEVMGDDHGRVGSILAERWNFPAPLRDVILHHPRPDACGALPAGTRALVEIVAAADALLAASGLPTCCRNGRKAPPVAGRPLGKEDEREALAAAREALGEAAAMFGVAEGAEGLAAAIREAEAGAPAAAPPAAVPVRVRIEEASAAACEAIRSLRTMNTADEAWEAGLRGIREALGVDRALFYAYDAERARLDIRYGLDDTGLIRPGERSPGDLPLAPGGALAHAIRDGTAVTVDDLGADLEFLRGVGVSRLAAAPVDILEKTHGVLTVDNIFSGRPVEPEDAALLGLLAVEVGLAVENLLLHKQTQKLRALAERDELTGVNNRRNLMALFQRELDRSRRYGSVLSVAMVDIDYFKSFNDTYGHQAGDEVLRTIAQVLVAASREIDIIGRYGGEEFVALLPETNLEQATIYAERLRARVELRGHDLRTRFPKTRTLTISGGVTQAVPAAGDDVERIIGRVDEALYEAKEAGRNRIIVKPASESE